jgi:hypothetical protein
VVTSGSRLNVQFFTNGGVTPDSLSLGILADFPLNLDRAFHEQAPTQHRFFIVREREKPQNRWMATPESFYKVDIPGATVYVDTDSYAKAGEVAMSVVQAKMLNSGATWNGPDPIRVKIDRDRLGAANHYQEIRYWIFQKVEA